MVMGWRAGVVRGARRDGPGSRLWAGLWLRLWLAAAFVGLFALSPAVLRAAPAGGENCAQMRAERNILVKKGVKAQMAKGPEWVLANLKGDGLEDLKRYIVLVERIKFRCVSYKVREARGKAKTAKPRKASAGKTRTAAKRPSRKRTRSSSKRRTVKKKSVVRKKKIRKKKIAKKKTAAPDVHAEVFN